MKRRKSSPGKPRKLAKSPSHQLRIIGGQWRGRKLNFAAGDGLRPTTDRVRETLFNWLQNDIVGSRCLDLFSGSGALGLEALSRHAGEVVMVDNNRQAIVMIKKNLETLGGNNARIMHMDAREFLMSQGDLPAEGSLLADSPTQTKRTFDIVFLDPPFNRQLVALFCRLLKETGCLSEQAMLYIEMEKGSVLPVLPQGWQVKKEKVAGQLAYYLVAISKQAP